MADFKWEPIKPLSEADRAVDLVGMPPLYESWRSSRDRLKASSSNNLEEFTRRLVRRLSIETGILERLYDLDRGTTEALVAQGFLEDLVSRSSTDIEPSRLIDILADHEAAVHLVTDCASGQRPLTRGITHELHAILTKHQDSTTAVDQFGTKLEIPLVKGAFKELPNNPKRPDGAIHEYCPPIHVASEMDNLLAWTEAARDEDPIVLASWFHHRFTQIHPYQDGNGRVARALTTLILLREELLPLVIDRDLRVGYIKALESADCGSLAPLAAMFARLEKGAILQALSIDVDAEVSYQRSLTEAVIDSIAQRLGKRREEKLKELRKVNETASGLRAQTRRMIEAALTQLKGPLAPLAEPDIHVADGGPDRGNAHWYKFEVTKSAQEASKFANLTEDHYFEKASIRVGRERLVFVVSFHHIGRELTGIMEATAFSKLESYEDSEDRSSVSQDFFLCALEPFVFTYTTNQADIADSFSRWLDAALAVAIKEYGDRL